MSYTGFGNGFDSSLMGDMGFQASENQGQWQFNGTGNGAITRQNTFGVQGMQNTDIIVSMVAGASEAILERVAFYMGLKMKNQEIVDRDKQIDLLKAHCDTLEGTIDKFARDYHTLNGAGGDGCRITFLTDLGLMLTPWKRDEHPEVTLWMKREWARVAKALALAHKGESSGDSPDVAKAKPKVGRPSKKDQEDADHKYLYLQGRDGVKMSAEKVSKMSVKANWAGNRGIRPKNTGEKTQKTVNDKDVLDDPSLVRMKSGNGSDDGINDSDDSIQPAGHVSESNNNRIDEMTPEPEDTGFPEADDASEENPGSSAQSPLGPNVPKENPSSSTQSSGSPFGCSWDILNVFKHPSPTAGSINQHYYRFGSRLSRDVTMPLPDLRRAEQPSLAPLTLFALNSPDTIPEYANSNADLASTSIIVHFEDYADPTRARVPQQAQHLPRFHGVMRPRA
ncbi:hypothetical protein EDB85DRAFT_2149862 [Lactarius pseudohatsudake]|nr:hypothetical protein EDB85DRAFT_2149862 [Lactarius pseudohatsudake]